MKLYRVKITYDVMVIAEDELDAEAQAKDHLQDIVDEEPTICSREHCEYVKGDCLPSGWSQHDIPYGKHPNGQRSIKRILEDK